MKVKQPFTRIHKRFSELRDSDRGGLITFITAGDPNLEVSTDILAGLPDAGADLIEIGMPFSDPMADGPAIQLSSQRALKNGMNLKKTISMVAEFRKYDDTTPIILMGYYNPIYHYGTQSFLFDAKKAGVDGLIIVDLPPEEENELCIPALNAGINFIYLMAPTTDDKRLPTILRNASGFLYFVSILGITGTKAAMLDDVKMHVDRIKLQTDVPIGVGFGIRTAEQAANISSIADAVVVGSALIDVVYKNVNKNGEVKIGTASKVLSLVQELSTAVRSARQRRFI